MARVKKTRRGGGSPPGRQTRSVAPGTQPPADAPWPWWMHTLVVVGIAAGVACAYWGARDAAFAFDDKDSILENDHLVLEEASIEELREAATGGMYGNRPLVNLTFAVNRKIWGLSPRAFHITNMAIHAASAAGVYVFLVCFLGDLGIRRDRSRWIAVAASAVWALHPIQTESVTYITQRYTSMAGLFYLWGLASFVAARHLASPWQRWIAIVAPGVLFPLAVFSKEWAVTFPFAVLLVEGLRRPSRRVLASLAALVVLYALGSVVAYRAFPPVRGVIDHATASLSEGSGEKARLLNRSFSMRERLLTQTRIVFWYSTLVLFPHPERLNVDHDWESGYEGAHSVSKSLQEPPATALALVGIAGAMSLAVVSWRRLPLVTFAILWYSLTLAVESSVIGLELAFEHRLYLASLGPILLVVAGVDLALSRTARPFQAAVLVASVCLFAGLTHVRNRVWETDESIWEDAARKSPGKARPQNNHGVALYQRRRYQEALVCFEAAVRLKWDYANAVQNLFQCNLVLERWASAVRVADHVLRFDLAPSARAETLARLGVALEKIDRIEDAGKTLFAATQCDPSNPSARSARAAFLGRRGDDASAIAIQEGAFRAQPGESDVAAGLAELYMKRGRIEDALRVAREHAGLVPGSAQAHFLYGTQLFNAGQLVESRAEFERALEIDTGHDGAKIGLSAVHGKSGDFDRSIEILEELRARGVVSIDLYGNLAASHVQKARARPEVRTEEYRRALAILEEGLTLPFGPKDVGELRRRIADIRAELESWTRE